jgi:hypothetical protein
MPQWKSVIATDSGWTILQTKAAFSAELARPFKIPWPALWRRERFAGWLAGNPQDFEKTAAPRLVLALSDQGSQV